MYLCSVDYILVIYFLLGDGLQLAWYHLCDVQEFKSCPIKGFLSEHNEMKELLPAPVMPINAITTSLELKSWSLMLAVTVQREEVEKGAYSGSMPSAKRSLGMVRLSSEADETSRQSSKRENFVVRDVLRFLGSSRRNLVKDFGGSCVAST